jgi:bifunctional enzyme CysN/CysC
MNVVVVGHVDHGKSTVIGRLLADTGSLPQGKLEQVKALCQKNAKPFEYAFLLDALKDEQAQGITIDTARCFFKTEKRDYIIIDAPGHIEFLKNMVTGAARAEAALLVIDAKEGVQENSRRHGTLLSMLGIHQVVVLVNKMDLVDYDPAVFESIRKEYTAFLGEVGIKPRGFVPISARDGVNLTHRAEGYEGLTVLEYMDSFVKQSETDELPFRFAVQDVYKFTEEGDDRRILAGTVESGSVSVGDPVTFYPSGKHSTIKTLEAFNRPALRTVSSGQAVGFTLSEELYIRPGELMCRAGETPACVSSRFRTHIFWLGKSPMIPEKRYKLKLATARVPVYLAEVRRVLDASNLKAETGKKRTGPPRRGGMRPGDGQTHRVRLVRPHRGDGAFRDRRQIRDRGWRNHPGSPPFQPRRIAGSNGKQRDHMGKRHGVRGGPRKTQSPQIKTDCSDGRFGGLCLQRRARKLKNACSIWAFRHTFSDFPTCAVV